jgi:RNA polymerase sigma-70 factor (ECF subfamily)
MALRATAVRNRDQDVFEDWYRAHNRPLQSYCTRFLQDRAAAADVTQEALLRAWTRRHEFASDAHVRPWLWRVARNLCIDTIRARQRVVPSDSLPEQEGEGGDPFTPFEQEDDRQAVQLAMGTLSERHQILLYLRDVQGVGYGELAAEMGVTEEGARAVLFRARRCLQQSLERLNGADEVPAHAA